MSSDSRLACPHTQAVLDAWLDGQLGELAEHARSCPLCAEALLAHKRLSAVLTAAPPPEPPPGACEAVLRAVPPSSSPYFRVAKRILAPAVALCIVGIALGAWAVIAGAKGSLAGGVHLRHNRQPLRGAWVVLVGGGEVVKIASTQDTGGGFRFPDVRVGGYELLGLCEGCVLPDPLAVRVTRGQTARVAVWLDRGPPVGPGHARGQVEGTVRDAHHRPVSHALIVLQQEGVVRGAVLTDTDGSYLFPSVSGEASALVVYATGRAPVRLDSVVPIPGRTLPVDVQVGQP